MKLTQGQKELEEVKALGLTPLEVNEWKEAKSKELFDLGLTQDEVKEYFGVPEYNPAPLQKGLEENLTKATDELKTKEGGVKQKEATGFLDALEAGFQISVTGLATRGKLPDTILPEHASTAERIASSLGTIAGDFPAMVAGTVGGAVAGGAAGSAVPVVGNVVGAVAGGGYGGNAAPEFIRQSLMAAYEEGSVDTPEEFWGKASKIFIETNKSGFIGALTAGAGKGAGAFLKNAGPVFKTTAEKSAEIATMTTAGAALNGELPKRQDFIDGAILVGGLSAAGTVAGKLRKHHAKTGKNPLELAADLENDMPTKQEFIKDVYGPPELAPETPAVKAEPPTLTEAQKSLREFRVGKPEKAKAPLVDLDTKKFYQDFVDQLSAVKEEAGDGVYKTTRMVNDYNGLVINFMEKGVVDFTTREVTGKSFKQVIEPFKADIEGLKDYLIAKRGLELIGREINPGKNFSPEAAKVAIKEFEKTYGDAAKNVSKDLADWQDGTLKYALDSGLISEDQFKNIKSKNKEYVPFARVEETESGGVSAKGKSKKPGSLKAIKGSDNRIVDPFESTLSNLQDIMRAAEVNRAKLELVDELIAREGNIKKVAAKMKAITVGADEIPGMTEDEATIFRPQAKDLAPNEIEVIRKGKREVYEVSPGIAEAVKGFSGDYQSASTAIKIMSKITAVKKLGISLTPEFILRNFIRDQVTARIYSQSKINLVDVFQAARSIVNKDESFFAWMRSGGSNAAFLELNQRYLNSTVLDLGNPLKNQSWVDTAINVATKGKDFFAATAMLAEQSTRLAEFKKLTKGDYSAAALKEAGFAAREVTLDFQKIGAKMRAFNMITAFQNVAIQDLDRTIRAARSNPEQVAAKAAMYITAPSVMLWLANKDDERYISLPDWQKDLFWIIPIDSWQDANQDDLKTYYPDHLKRMVDGKLKINKGPILRIPKPGIMGLLFGSGVERTLDMVIKNDPKAFSNISDSIGGLISPAIVPDAALPFVEAIYNKSEFTGAPLIPSHLEDVAGDLQYTNYTSEAAKGLGKLINMTPGLRYSDYKKIGSPIVIDNFIRSYTGTLGASVLSLADQAASAAGISKVERPSPQLADIPIIKAFVVRYPSAALQDDVDFNESQKKAKSVEATVKLLESRQDVDGLMKELNDPYSLQLKLSRVRDIEKNRQDLAKSIQTIYNSNMKPGEKRQIIEGLYLARNTLAKAGNKTVAEMETHFKKGRSSILFKQYFTKEGNSK